MATANIHLDIAGDLLISFANLHGGLEMSDFETDLNRTVQAFVAEISELARRAASRRWSQHSVEKADGPPLVGL